LPGPWPPPAPLNQEIYLANGSGLRLIHLGFDVEGNTAHLGQLLDTLDKHGVKTTMFIMGSWAEQNPSWVKEMAARGHELANHTYSHANMRDMTPEQVAQELNDTERIVQNLTGQSTKPWFRPPFGSRSPESIQTTYDQGWTTLIWTGGTEDWRPDTTAQTMCDYLADQAYPGAILYSHTYHPDVPTTVDHFISNLQRVGYTFVPISIIMNPNPNAYLQPR
ncbi:MAG TPA: polysaccharide deacetylase family protein, partial [Anaerolineae bacterium]|nr:polysaccharide deacetylase family protein [Anaerolineae bacterium]